MATQPDHLRFVKVCTKLMKSGSRNKVKTRPPSITAEGDARSAEAMDLNAVTALTREDKSA